MGTSARVDEGPRRRRRLRLAGVYCGDSDLPATVAATPTCCEELETSDSLQQLQTAEKVESGLWE